MMDNLLTRTSTRNNRSCVNDVLKCVYFVWQVVDAEDLNSGCYTIDDVILPMPG